MNKSRVLGYYTSKELTKEDLMQISGGSAKGTLKETRLMTNSPINLDVSYDYRRD